MLVVCGSTGEAATLLASDQVSSVRATAEAADNQAPMFAGWVGSATDAAIAPVMAASRHCASVLLCAPPAYPKPPPEGVSAHVRAMAQAEDLPVILYDATSRTGIAVADETVACLVESGMNVAINDQAATSDVRRGSAPCAAASW